MEVLKAYCSIPDWQMMEAMTKTHMDQRIKRELARSLADALVEKFIDKATIKRHHPVIYAPGETRCELEIYVTTAEDRQELEGLRRFRDQMKQFVK